MTDLLRPVVIQDIHLTGPALHMQCISTCQDSIKVTSHNPSSLPPTGSATYINLHDHHSNPSFLPSPHNPPNISITTPTTKMNKTRLPTLASSISQALPLSLFKHQRTLMNPMTHHLSQTPRQRTHVSAH
jgi:hypothetical protein